MIEIIKADIILWILLVFEFIGLIIIVYELITSPLISPFKDEGEE